MASVGRLLLGPLNYVTIVKNSLVAKFVPNYALISHNRNSHGSNSLIRGYSSTSSQDEVLKTRDTWSTLSNDGSVIICWHPEPKFPYEYSRPLPEVEPEIREGDSVLKVQYRYADLHRYRPDGPTDQDLQRMTFTTKHQWFPHKEKRYRKPNPPRNREGI